MSKKVDKNRMFLSALETALSYVETTIKMFESMNSNLKAITGKKSFSIDHLIFTLTTERELIREEIFKIRRKIGEQ